MHNRKLETKPTLDGFVTCEPGLGQEALTFLSLQGWDADRLISESPMMLST